MSCPAGLSPQVWRSSPLELLPMKETRDQAPTRLLWLMISLEQAAQRAGVVPGRSCREDLVRASLQQCVRFVAQRSSVRADQVPEGKRQQTAKISDARVTGEPPGGWNVRGADEPLRRKEVTALGREEFID